MTNDEIAQSCVILILALFIVGMVTYMIVDFIKGRIEDRRDEKRRQAEEEERNRQETRQFCTKAEYAKRDADKHGIEYAFGKAECDERERINKAIDAHSHRGLYSCELDFPVSQRSLEWLRYSGFEVSQTDGKTKVSWENAKT